MRLLTKNFENGRFKVPRNEYLGPSRIYDEILKAIMNPPKTIPTTKKLRKPVCPKYSGSKKR